MIEPAARERAVRLHTLKNELVRLLVNARNAKVAVGVALSDADFAIAAMGAVATLAADAIDPHAPAAQPQLVHAFEQLLADAADGLREPAGSGDGPRAA